MMTIDSTTKKLFKDPVKRRAWVIYQMSLQGKSMADLARELGVSRHLPRAALMIPYPKIERAIASAVDVPVSVLFPERYAPDGSRLIRMGRPKKSTTKRIDNNTASALRNVNKSEAV